MTNEQARAVMGRHMTVWQPEERATRQQLKTAWSNGFMTGAIVGCAMLALGSIFAIEGCRNYMREQAIKTEADIMATLMECAGGVNYKGMRRE